MIRFFLPLFLAALASAQGLRVYYRQTDSGVSKIYLVPADSKAKLEGRPCTGGPCYDPQALLTLLKPASVRVGRSEPVSTTFELKDLILCNVKGSNKKCPSLKKLDGSRFQGAFLELTTTQKIEEALADYLPAGAPAGERFEAIVQIKNLWIDGQPTTQTVTIPTALELELDDQETIYEDGIATFRVLFAQPDIENKLGDKDSWEAVGAPDGVELKGVKYDKESRAIQFFLPHMVRQPDSPIEFAPKPKLTDGDRLAVNKAENGRSPFLYRRRGSKAAPTSGRGAPAGSPPATVRWGKPRKFKTNAAVVSQDLPLFLRGLYSYNGESSSRHVFTIEGSVAADEGFALPPIWQSDLNQFSFTPHLKFDVNKDSAFDNPNSITWNLPVNFTHFFPGAWDDNRSRYVRPGLRTVAFLAGLAGENSTRGQVQNLTVPILVQTRLSALRKGWDVRAEFTGGMELGQSLSTQIKPLTLDRGDPDRDVSPVVINQKIDIKNRDIRRLRTEANFAFSKGKRFSFQSLFQVRKLFSEEVLITTRQVEGRFVPDSGQVILKPPAVSPANVATEFAVLDTKFDRSNRVYFELGAKYALTDHLGFDVVYKRGVKVPSFQEVNLFQAGFSFELGRVEK